MDNNRKAVFKALVRIEKDGAYSNLLLNQIIESEKPDSPSFVREMTYGVTENKMYLDYLLDQIVNRGIRKVRTEPRTLLRMGIYQMIFMDSVPDYASVNETVRLARKYCFSQANFVNAVLRNFQRKKDDIRQPKDEADPIVRLSATYSFDPWIVRLWIDQYGEEKAEELLSSSIGTPPMMIRVNTLKTSAAVLSKKLERKGYRVLEFPDSRRVLTVKGSNLLEQPEYVQGLFSVQDAASVIAMEALDPKPGDTIVDVCAAPFGKSFACAEIMGDSGSIYAFDKYSHKVARCAETAERLGVTIVQAEAQDALEPREELFGRADRVICDVPCSGLGVIRRKPEIKYKKLDDQGKELASIQKKILTASAQYVKEGGSLMYSTCTINSIENRDVIRSFLKKHPHFTLVSSRQLLPITDGTDGFFFCLMKKRY